MSNETRVHGPPGTGKTGKLANEIIPKLADKYGADKIMLTSFTKAAAKELGSRIQTNNDTNIGTLHSICFKALGMPLLTEKYINDWNKSHAAFSFSGANQNRYNEYQIYRNKMISKDKWDKKTLIFAKVWEAWKKKNKLFDFIDLIEQAGELFSPPGRPSAIVIDEAQDFTKLEMSVLRRWATQVREFWVVGDDDQCIYSFSGASPENMLLPELPDEQKIILNQSYRIPKAVHKVAEKIIHQVSFREEKKYNPRNFEGVVLKGDTGYEDTDWLFKTIKKTTGTSMIIASCNYMLETILRNLKSNGFAFSNPWRPEEKSWNPLNNKGSDTIRAFLNKGDDGEFWSTQQFVTWASELKVGPTGLKRIQGKAGLKQLKTILETDPMNPGLYTCSGYINDILSPDAIINAKKRDLNWLSENVNKRAQKTLKYPLIVHKKHGETALLTAPKLFIGTIHSFKGGEADNVFLYPDISISSIRDTGLSKQEDKDNLCRLFYVGVTRTKNTLYLMPPTSNLFFHI